MIVQARIASEPSSTLEFLAKMGEARGDARAAEDAAGDDGVVVAAFLHVSPPPRRLAPGGGALWGEGAGAPAFRRSLSSSRRWPGAAVGDGPRGSSGRRLRGPSLRGQWFLPLSTLLNLSPSLGQGTSVES